MNYIFDTNILLIYLRDEKRKQFIEKEYAPFAPENKPIISIVTVGEIESLLLRNKWGKRRITAVEKFLKKFLIIDIRHKRLIDLYGKIDAFSSGKLEGIPLNMSARNMGKNDLWIAATAALTNSKLITTDKDFSHLDKVFFDLELLDRY